MNWGTVTFDWNQVRAFLVTAEEGSLSAAARSLGLAQSTLSRQVDALEQSLGVVLFERLGRRLVLAPAGEALLIHARALGVAASRFGLAATGQATAIEGTITITTSEVYAAFLMPGIIARLRAAEPRILVDLVASNEASDLQQREADIAIRSVRPTNPALIARKIRDVSARLFAAPAYLQALGPIHGPADLSRAHFIGFDRTERLSRALGSLGLSLGLHNFPVVTSNHLVNWQLVKQGLGIGVVPEEIGLAEPAVRPVLPSLPGFPTQIWLLAHRELLSSPRVRIVFDFLAEALVSPAVTR